MNNAETIVKVRTELLNTINSSGLSPIELQYIIGPIMEEINGIITQQEQAVVDKYNATAAVENGGEKTIQEGDIEVAENADEVIGNESNDGEE